MNANIRTWILWILAAIAVGEGAYLLLSSPSKTWGIRIYSYSTFANSWGPGPILAKEFEKICDCNVELVDAGDAGIMIRRLRIVEETPDLVLGIDQYGIESVGQVEWRDLTKLVPKEVVFPVHKNSFVPIDWSPMTFIYRKGEIEPPKSLDDLLDSRFSKAVAIQDPRSSSPGMQLLGWIEHEKGPKASAYLEKLKPSLQSISPGWTGAYGIFKKGEAKMVFSYLTSAAYHWREEKDEKYQPAIFESGHPVQIEYVGIPAASPNAETAEKFVKYLLSEQAQKILVEKNFMLPVVPGVERGTEFERLPKLKLLSTINSKDAGSAIEKWKSLFR